MYNIFKDLFMHFFFGGGGFLFNRLRFYLLKQNSCASIENRKMYTFLWNKVGQALLYIAETPKKLLLNQAQKEPYHWKRNKQNLLGVTGFNKGLLFCWRRGILPAFAPFGAFSGHRPLKVKFVQKYMIVKSKEENISVYQLLSTIANLFQQSLVLHP